MKNKKLLKILFIALIVVVCGVIFTFVKESNAGSQEIISEESESSENEDASAESGEDSGQETEETQSEDTVCVHVCGAVNSPGVYYLEADARVHEAVELAGGLSDEAAEEYINMARVLTDGEQIYVPTRQEAEEEGLEISYSESSGQEESSLVNINTATSEQLQTLPGIGETKAAAIISYREENGDFSSAEDITNVSGIGSSTYENIKDYITV